MKFIINDREYDIVHYMKSPYLSLVVKYNRDDVISIHLDFTEDIIENYISYIDDRDFNIDYNFDVIMDFMGHHMNYVNFQSPYDKIVVKNKWTLMNNDSDVIYYGGMNMFICGRFCMSDITDYNMNYYFFVSYVDLNVMLKKFTALDYDVEHEKNHVIFSKDTDVKVLCTTIFRDISDIQEYISDRSEIPDNFEILYDVKKNDLYCSDKYRYSLENKTIHIDELKLNMRYLISVFYHSHRYGYRVESYMAEKKMYDIFMYIYDRVKDRYMTVHNIVHNVYRMRLKKICDDFNIEYHDNYSVNDNAVSFFNNYDEGEFYMMMSKISLNFNTMINYINSNCNNIYEFLILSYINHI